MHVTTVFNWLSIAALGFMSWGIIGQWLKIRHRTSIEEISLREVTIRWTVTVVLLVKIILVKDPYLIAGQLLLLAGISLYFGTLVIIKNRHHE
ncbi:MAG: hypothetical protein AAB479_00865 [Patescibacteria group bacterium]